MKYRFLLVTCLYVLGYMISFGQPISLTFSQFNKQDGLNQSSVNFIFQDYQDFVWIANFGGLNRFDGYEFKSYTHEFGDSTSIPDNSVWSIYECRDSSLWFGTKKGISLFHRDRGNFTNYYIPSSGVSSKTVAVKALFEDHMGKFYVGSEEKGLYTFDRSEARFELVEALPEEAIVRAITEDRNHNLWVGTENRGLFKISEDRKTAVRFLPEGKLKVKSILSLCTDKLGDVWIGTDEDGLLRYEQEKEAFSFCIQDSLSKHYKSGTRIKTLIHGFMGHLWIGSATEGLAYYDYEQDRFYQYQNNPYDPASLQDNDVSSLHAGANGILYIGFYMKGFAKAFSSPFHQLKSNPLAPNSLSNNNVYSMYQDRQGRLWMGTFGGGLNAYDPEKGTFKHYRHNKNDKSSLSHDWIRIMFEDSKNRFWVGTWAGGLNLFDRETGKAKRYFHSLNEPNSLSMNIVTAIFEDRDGELWFGTYGGGINIYQPETDDFRHFVHEEADPQSLSDNHITSFYEDEKGTIWICTYGGGLNAYDKENGTFRRILPDPQKPHSLNNHKTLHIFPEKDSAFFWLTTLGGGLNKYYVEEDKFIHFTEKEGLSNNSTMGMLKDHLGQYWISSNMGIARFDPVGEQFRNYSMVDGLGSDDYNLEAYMQTADGTMYFGGKKGVTYFNPRDVKDLNIYPQIVFTHLAWEDDSLVHIPQQVTIPYRSHITLDFAAVNADKTAHISYAYQLVGADKERRMLDEVRHLEFSNLSPKSYELRVWSTNGNKKWNENYTSLFIRIPRP